MDDDGSRSECIHTSNDEQEFASLLLAENSDPMTYCEKHNIRKINIRSLSELMKKYTIVARNFDEAQLYPWTKYFNADFTLSRNCSSEHGFIRKALLERMIDLDESLYEAFAGYKGHSK